MGRKSGVEVPLPEIILKSNDFVQQEYSNRKTGVVFHLSFYSTLVDDKVVQRDILPYLLERHFEFIDDVTAIVPMTGIEILDKPDKLEEKVLRGYLLLTVGTDPGKFALFETKEANTRAIAPPEVEFSVLGPKEAFVESLVLNTNLIRKRLPIKELVTEEVTIGSLTKTKVSIFHIEGLTNPENVKIISDRIKAIDFDAIIDSSYIVQLISDNRYSPFPQLLDTERPDRVAAILAEGKVAVLVDGSPHALIGPTTLGEFFSSFDDYFLNWILASFFRLIRFFSIAFSVLVTPLYVAVLTFHYELIPKDLLTTLVSSRRVIPFPPILEAVILELTIELLREAGARLPTKVGQTIGIVGGIVIGTASVDAGLTSNVLLIFVALAALASFTTPVYKMGNTIRLLRFPFLLFASLWGLLGIAFCLCILLTHLIRLTSMNKPFLQPFYPPRMVDHKDVLIRFPFSAERTRPLFLHTLNPFRFSSKKMKKLKEMRDIDE
ncbi:spore germination protein [Neobacillus notoginsengisoli]|uniref:Spore germination protein n=1 Tax=Neobacillus notoginsengisoli TaxID=1578198 RepID=A0A417YSQ1_9BACI|nr:spore germination protein [Neobacillus notoginsengisoli]RHW39017.1 spore germination protein [Neobacillus notoginsengisoli]